METSTFDFKELIKSPYMWVGLIVGAFLLPKVAPKLFRGR